MLNLSIYSMVGIAMQTGVAFVATDLCVAGSLTSNHQLFLSPHSQTKASTDALLYGPVVTQNVDDFSRGVSNEWNLSPEKLNTFWH